MQSKSASQAAWCNTDEMEASPACQSFVCQPASQDSQQSHGDDTSSTLLSTNSTSAVRDRQQPSTSMITNEKTLIDKILATHPHVDTNICPLCQRVLKSKYNVKRHIFNLHIHYYKIDKGDKNINIIIEKYLTKTEIEHFKKRKYKCNICFKLFYDKCKLDEHSQACPKNKRQTCPLCRETLCFTERIKQHVQSNHLNKEPYYCCSCGENFTEKSSFQIHIESTHKIVLTKVVSQRYKVAVKMLENPDSKVFNVCPLCTKAFSSMFSLRSHFCSFHLSFKCRGCLKYFPDIQAISKYQNYETKDSNVESLECEGKQQEKPSLCEACKTKPADKIREKKFQCANCEQNFTQKFSLKTHILNFHIKKSMKLKRVCKYKAAEKILKKHIHLDPKMCPLCRKIFTRRSNVKIHIFKMHLNLN